MCVIWPVWPSHGVELTRAWQVHHTALCEDAIMNPSTDQSHFPQYSLESSSVLYGGWNASFQLRSSSGLQTFKMSLGVNVSLTKDSMQEAMVFIEDIHSCVYSDTVHEHKLRPGHVTMSYYLQLTEPQPHS